MRCGMRLVSHRPASSPRPVLDPVMNTRAMRPSLPARSPALQRSFHVERAQRIGGGKRLLDVLHERRPREVISQGAAVHVPLARSGTDVEAADALFAASDRVNHGPVVHHLLSLCLRVNTAGCWAA